MYKILVFTFLMLALTLPAAAFASVDTTIEIHAVGGLQYDVVRFHVRPGTRVTLILTNKDDMSHNMLITSPGTRLKVVNAAIDLGSSGEKMDYVPATPDVLWAVSMLLPGETKTLNFTAPRTAGVYPYVCTYPGHGFLMFGAMYVTDEPMPPLQQDRNIPLERRNDIAKPGHYPKTHRARPFREKPPFMYRIFLPESSPASIAVNLPHRLSYCWDAAECRLRYAWQGGFLDNTDIWKGHHDSYATIMGPVFYRDKTAFPLQPDKPGNIPVVQFKGYKLIDRYPEFHYTVDGIHVYELIKPKQDGTGLIRTFRIPQTDRVMWFVFDRGDGVQYEATSGTWVNNALRIVPAQAKEFTIIMTKK